MKPKAKLTGMIRDILIVNFKFVRTNTDGLIFNNRGFMNVFGSINEYHDSYTTARFQWFTPLRGVDL